MSWSKLKNIIILLLVLVNLSLGGLLLYDRQREKGLQQEAMENAVAILQDQGLSVQAGVGEMSLAALEVQRDQAREESLAGALLGEVRREDRGAGVYRYAGERGTIQFHANGEFTASFPMGAFPIGEETMENHAVETLALLDFQGEVAEVRTEGDATIVTVDERYEGVPLISCQASLTYEGGHLTAISQGRRLNGTPYLPAGEGDQPVTAASALLHLLNGLRERGDVCSAVTGAVECYRLDTGISAPARLVPVWKFTTDTGIYLLDAMTGELTPEGAQTRTAEAIAADTDGQTAVTATPDAEPAR